MNDYYNKAQESLNKLDMIANLMLRNAEDLEKEGLMDLSKMFKSFSESISLACSFIHPVLDNDIILDNVSDPYPDLSETEFKALKEMVKDINSESHKRIMIDEIKPGNFRDTNLSEYHSEICYETINGVDYEVFIKRMKKNHD